MPEGWQAVEEPQGWSLVTEAESNKDKLQRILRERAKLPERKYSTVRTGAEQSLSDLVETFNPVSNIKGIGQAAYGTVAGMIPRSIPEAVNPATQLQKFITDPMMATQGQANVAFRQGRGPEAAFKGVAATVPIIGPAAAGIYDTAMGGQPGEAMGQGQFLVGTLAAPEVPAVQKLGSLVERATKPLPKPTPRELAARTEYAPNVAALRERITAAQPKPSTQPVEYARQVLTERIRRNVEETHAAVRKELDTRWDAMRQAVGDAPADAAKLAEVEAEARSAHLSTATPKAIADFDAVMNRVREPGGGDLFENQVAEGLGYKPAGKANKSAADVARTQIAGGAKTFDNMVAKLREEAGVTAEPGGTFAELQSRYTRLGEELSKGNLPNETFRALKQVREGLGQQMQEMAAQRGMGAELGKLKSDWSRYMEDFRNSDSPVARALAAKDLPVVTRNAAGNTYARFAEIMGRNRAYGGNPVLVQELAGLKAREAAIRATKPKPKTATTKPPAAVKPSRLKLLLGGAVGAAAGSVVGHPVLGYYAGKEAARAVFKK